MDKYWAGLGYQPDYAKAFVENGMRYIPMKLEVADG